MSQKSRYKVHTDGLDRPLEIVAESYDATDDFVVFYSDNRAVATVSTSRLIAITEEDRTIDPPEAG